MHLVTKFSRGNVREVLLILKTLLSMIQRKSPTIFKVIIALLIFLATFSLISAEREYFINVTDENNITKLQKKINYSFDSTISNPYLTKENPKIKLKIGDVLTNNIVDSKIKDSILNIKSDKKQYYLMTLNRNPSEVEILRLKERGISLLSYIPDNTWYVSLDSKASEEFLFNNSQIKLKTLSDPFLIRDISEIKQNYKVSSAISEDRVGSWSYNQEGDLVINVLFFNDVSEKEARTFLQGEQAKIYAKIDFANLYVVSINEDRINSIVSNPKVSWVEEMQPPGEDQLSQSLPALEISSLYNSPYSLTGSGIQILQMEEGVAWNHIAFEDRIFYPESVNDTGESNHATSIAGIMVGDGSGNLSLRGIAPNAQIYAYEHDYGVNDTDWNNISTVDNDYIEGINTYGVDVITNSWNLLLNASTVQYLGEYSSFEAIIDDFLVGGANNSRMVPIIWSAGNFQNRTVTTSLDYGTIGSKPSAKNVIGVGNVNLNFSIEKNSARGPTYDGRLKPEIVAIGCIDDTVSSEIGIFSTVDTSSYSRYLVTSLAPPACGTSQSTPHVTGLTALMLEEWDNSKTGIPRPATVKAILVDSSTDLEKDGSGNLVNDGPDFINGYGHINGTEAIDRIKDHTVIEETINDEYDVEYYSIEISGETQIKVTMAWDDPPLYASAASQLVNDLDLKFISPSGKTFYPWTLDDSNPSNAAVRNKANREDNLEQVVVNSTEIEDGNWTVIVSAHSCISTYCPQNFSLVSELSLGTNFTQLDEDNHLIAYYPFDNVLNNTQSTYDGIAYGSPNYVSGKNGQAINLDGTNDYINMGSLGSNFENITITSWLRDNNSDSWYLGLVYKGGTGSDYDFYVGKGWGLMHSRIKKGSSAYQLYSDSSEDISEEEWHHYSWTLEKVSPSIVEVTMYRDGEIIAEDNITGPIDKDFSNWYIGTRWSGGGGYYKGNIDDLSIWDRTLKQNEIIQIYTSGVKLNTTSGNSSSSGGNLTDGLLVHYTFENSSYNDSSGNGNTGTAYGGPTFNTSGYNGTSLILDGSNDYIAMGALGQSVQNVTIAAWVYDQNGDTGYRGLAYKGIPTQTGGYDWYVGKAWGYMHTRIAGGASQLYSDNTSDIEENNWHHYVWVLEKDGTDTDVSMYKDGNLVKAGTLSNVLGTTHNQWHIGRTWSHAGNGYYKAQIDEYAIWNRPLSSSEVSDLYSLGISY